MIIKAFFFSDLFELCWVEPRTACMLGESSAQGFASPYAVGLLCTSASPQLRRQNWEKGFLFQRRERYPGRLLQIQGVRRKSRSSQLVLMESQNAKNSKNLGLF